MEVLRYKRDRGPLSWGSSVSSWRLVPWSSWKSFRLSLCPQGKSFSRIFYLSSHWCEKLQQFHPDSQVPSTNSKEVPDPGVMENKTSKFPSNRVRESRRTG